MEVRGLETHDVGRNLNALENGFWINDILSVCRTGEPIALPPGSIATMITGDGLVWYDTEQEHILSNATYRQCEFIAIVC